MAVLSLPVPHPLILCIDDSEMGLRVRKWLLASVGYEVLTATTVEEGFELFKKNPVVLVIADHFLGAESGPEIAREMKHLKPEVRILIVSAELDETLGLSSRMDSCLSVSQRSYCFRRLLGLSPRE